ncbi:uncharacterized protein LY89DRAFT_592922 [Mollisia scopiformis]|uniref:Chitin-binding type-1 domain-containing protein n=1 Tax=Mollisia scopiformis TaxID=149040 RepID=A0A194WWG7_MOLSC|nr:uncharacterized protein LY89DRAFT_592922 [Mollisia scopiformis]KUJ12321.1 hypothetical protein LY89DRAFT_592922 [Mollisia scopiformis]
MSTFRFLLATLLLSSTVFGHMEMIYPMPLRYKNNPFATTIDYSMTSPLTVGGTNAAFPCKGYQSDMGTAAGTSTATWTQGSSVNFTLDGSAVHGGGSCQAALSTDVGKTWYVIHTYQGGCPLAAGSFKLDIPSDAPTGSALFAWLWYNNVGNREIYMNCASITIASGTGAAPATAFKDRPDLFVANLDNGCTTVETTDVIIPNPGPDVTTGGTKEGAVSGTCTPVNGIGGRTGSASSGGSTSVAPDASSGSTAPTASSAPPASSISPTVDGQCSGSQTCAGQSIYGPCCSQWGYCGNTNAHCGAGCMAGFGTCGVNGTASSARRARHVRQFVA